MLLKTVRLPDHVVTKLLSGPRLIGGGGVLAPKVSPVAELVGAEYDYELGELVLRFSDPDPGAASAEADSPNSSC